jgi:hypothetical protein
MKILLGLIFQVYATVYPKIIPPESLRIGEVGFGLTVFKGEKIEKFLVEILGVERNWIGLNSIPIVYIKGKHHPTILRAGIAQGMSGSPIYVLRKGKPRLVGAIAYGMSFDKDPIALVVPATVMLNISEKSSSIGSIKLNGPFSFKVIENLKNHDLKQFGAEFEEFLRNLNFVNSSFEVVSLSKKTKKIKLQPGTAITVYLTLGDISLSAAGTVTMVKGDTFFAFGHPFLNTGITCLPVSLSRVIYTVSNYRSSYKIVENGKIIGTITNDYAYGIKGKLNLKPDLLPIEYTLSYFSQTETLKKNLKVEVAKIPGFWTNYLIFVLTYYTIYGGVIHFNLPYQKNAAIFLKTKIVLTDKELVSTAKILYEAEDDDGIYWEVVKLYEKLRTLSLLNKTVKKIEFFVEYHPEEKEKLISLENLETDRFYYNPQDTIKVNLKLLKDSIFYKTIKTIPIPQDVDTGLVYILLKSSEYFNLENELKVLTEDQLFQLLSANFNDIFLKIIFPQKKIISKGVKDTIKIDDTIWEKGGKEEKEKKIVIEKLETPSKIMLNEVLRVKIVKEKIKEVKKIKKKKKKFFIF